MNNVSANYPGIITWLDDKFGSPIITVLPDILTLTEDIH